MKEDFIKYFEEASVENLDELIGSLMVLANQLLDYDEGLRVLRSSGYDESSTNVLLSREILLCSLAEKIPSDVVFEEGVELKLRGISFYRRSKSGKKYQFTTPFKRDLSDFLQHIMLPLQVDIGAEFNKSSEYFVRSVLNNYVIDQREFRKIVGFIAGSQTDDLDDLYEELCSPPESPDPLIEVDSGVHVEMVAHLNIRKLLTFLFGEHESETIQKSQYILFHAVGLFVLCDGKIVNIPANHQYRTFFQLPNQPKNPEKKREIELSVTGKIRGAIGTAVAVAMQDDRVELHKYERTEQLLKEISGVRFDAFNIRINGIFEDEKNIEALIEYVRLRSEQLGMFYNQIVIGHLNHEPGKNTDLVSSVFRAQRRLAQFLNPQYMGGRFLGMDKLRFPITAEDVVMMGEHGEKYRPLMDKFLLADIFSLMITSHKEMYGEFRRLVGNARLGTEIQALKKHGFADARAAEVAALLQYFMHFGSKFLDETTMRNPDPSLPQPFRNYFKRNLTRNEMALPEGEK